MQQNQTDTELIGLIAKSDSKAFKQLFDRYFTPLSIYADKILNDTDIAIDVVQSLFVSMFENRKTLNVTSVKSFLYQSVRNRCLNELKRLKVRSDYAARAMAANVAAAPDNIEDNIAAAELEARLTAAIEQLPPQCRKIFEMSRLKGLTNDEIAQELGLSKRTVETQISKALASLRKSLGPLYTVIMLTYLTLN